MGSAFGSSTRRLVLVGLLRTKPEAFRGSEGIKWSASTFVRAFRHTDGKVKRRNVSKWSKWFHESSGSSNRYGFLELHPVWQVCEARQVSSRRTLPPTQTYTSVNRSVYVMEQRYLSLQERCRRGSLPLKKRRLSLEPWDECPHTPRPNLTVLPERTITLSTGCDQRIAALALVAAAASSGFYSQVPFLPIEDFPRSSLPPASLKATLLHPTTLAPTTTPTAAQASMDIPNSPWSPGSARLPLSSPLPGGCHGKTSRNNSFCRRQPCYKGSNYCKLHYQHYTAGNRSGLLDDDDDSSSIAPTTSPDVVHQDRRFTGAPGEQCCTATTTRGRACAYVAVHGSKFCYLHSDYETNPPPRRGATDLKATLDGPLTKNLQALDKLSIPLAEVSVMSPPSVSSDGSSRLSSPLPPIPSGKTGKPKGTGRRTSAKLAEKHADSPYPLLSMVSTDQWFGKMVTVATGPMTNQVGRVEKWGNGWVTINIKGAGHHNRRSFELYLRSEDFDGSKRVKPSKSSLIRSLSSIETASPSPTQASDSGLSIPELLSKAGSPMLNLSTTVGLADPGPVQIPETPRPEKDIHPSVSDLTDDSLVDLSKVATELLDVVMEHLHEVTPCSPEKSTTDLPLVETLVLAQEGGAKKHNLDLLFGTAAVDRGRRTVHKPTRYEDTAMMMGKPRRRDSES